MQKVPGNKYYSHLAQEHVSSRVSCVYCKTSNHAIAKYFKFKSLTVAHRRRFVYDNRLCFKCFSPHNASQCKLNNCLICKQPHHLLHYEKCSSREAAGDKSNYQNSEKKNKNLVFLSENLTGNSVKHQFNQAGENRQNNGGIYSTCAETKTSFWLKLKIMSNCCCESCK